MENVNCGKNLKVKRIHGIAVFCNCRKGHDGTSKDNTARGVTKRFRVYQCTGNSNPNTRILTK